MLHTLAMIAYNNICNMMHKNAAHTYDAQKSSTHLGCSLMMPNNYSQNASIIYVHQKCCKNL